MISKQFSSLSFHFNHINNYTITLIYYCILIPVWLQYLNKWNSNINSSKAVVPVNITGTNDFMQCVTHREAVFGMTIHCIFDVWHYEVLRTDVLTWLLWFTCNFVDLKVLILYIMLHCKHVTKLPNPLHCTIPCMLWSTHLIVLDCTLPASMTVCSPLFLMAHSHPAWLYAPKQALKMLPSTLRVHSQLYLWVCSQVHSRACSPGCSQFHSMVYFKPAPMYTLTYSRLHTHSLLDCTVGSKLLRHTQVHSQACSQWCSQLHSMVHSQLAWLYSTVYALKTIPSTLPSMLLSPVTNALDDKHPVYLALCFNIHCQEAIHSKSHLTICFHMCSCILDPETCWVAGTKHWQT